MLFWEGLYLLCYSIPLGIAAGFGVGWGAVQILHKEMGMDVDFHMKPQLLLVGIFLGCAGLFAGMAIPTLMAMRVPLVGAITVSGNHRRNKSIRERLHTKHKRKTRRLTFVQVSRSHERLNWKNRILTGVIAAVTAVLLVSAVHLGYLCFEPYRETVEEQNRPN